MKRSFFIGLLEVFSLTLLNASNRKPLKGFTRAISQPPLLFGTEKGKNVMIVNVQVYDVTVFVCVTIGDSLIHPWLKTEIQVCETVSHFRNTTALRRCASLRQIQDEE